MNPKSRGNFKPGTCFDTCECRQCKPTDEPQRFHKVYGSKTDSNDTLSISITMHNAPDGSRLEKPMSEAYHRSICKRKAISDKTHKTYYPGDYGTGRKGLP